MGNTVTVQLEDDPIRVTPTGRIAVVDAIAALSEDGCPRCIWEELQHNHPHVSELCEGYAFSNDENVPVADRESWGIIQSLLLDRLIAKYRDCHNNVPIAKEGVSLFFGMDISIPARFCAPGLEMKSDRLVAK